MTYWLILLIFLYAALATAVLGRSRSPASILVAAYAVSAAVVTGGYLVLGTTPDRSTANLASLVVLIVASWSYLGLLPLTLTALYFESCLRQHTRRLLIGVETGLLVFTFALLWALRGEALVQRIDTHAWVPALLADAARSWTLSALVVLGGQVVYVIPVAAAIHFRRVTLRRGAVPLLLATVLSLLVPMLAPLAGARAWLTVVALGYGPPVVLLTALLIRAARQMTLERLVRASLEAQPNDLLVLDQSQRVVWRSASLLRWLDNPAEELLTPPHIDEMLRGSPLQAAVHHLLTSDLAAVECSLALSGEDYVLQITRQPLPSLPGAKLLAFRDITAAQVRRNLDEQRASLLALSAISAEISSSLDEAQVIERALQQVVPLTHAVWAAVYLAERDQLRLARSSPASGTPPPAARPLDGSTPARAMAQRAPVLAPDLPSGAEVSVPLLARGEALGALQVGFAQPRPFEGVEVAMLESVARQLAVAIDNARLHTQERQQRRLAEVLRAVANIVASQREDDALRAALLQLRDLLEFDRAAMLLIAEPGTLRIAAQLGFADVPPEGLGDVRIEVARYPYLRKLLDERAPEVIEDTALDPVWQPSEHRYRSWLGIPLVTRERVLGCLSVGCFEPNRFDAGALQLARTFADQVVIAVENAELFATEQRRRLHAEQLQQASYRMVTSQDLDGALLATLEGLSHSVAFDRAQIAMIDHAAGTWTFRTTYPASSTVSINQALPLTDFPLAARVIADQRPLLVPDTDAEPGWMPERYGPRRVRCWAGMPLIVRGTVIGLLNADSYHPHAFGEEDLQILQAFSNQAAAVFENFRLLEEASRQNRALMALNNVLAASNEALTHENLVIVALERVLAALDLKGGVIHRLDPVARELRLWATSGVPKAVIRGLDRVPAETEPGAMQIPAVRAGGEVYRFFSVPLVSHGQNLGLLSIRERPRAPLGPELRDLLRQLGQQLGVVMDNAVLFDTTVRRVGLSNDLGRLSLAISAHLNQDAVLELICRESISIFDVQGAYVWLLQGEKLVGVAAYGPGSEGFRGHTIPLSDSGLLPAQVIADWRPRYVNHVDETSALPPDLLALTGARAALAVPLLRADVALGTLLLVHTEQSDAFAAWFTEQIGLLGVQAALALQNATLFDEVRRRFDQLRLVNEVGRYATAILSPAVLVEGVARKLYNILHYDLISLLLVEDGELRLISAYLGAEPLRAENPLPPFTAPHSVASEAVRQAEPVLRNQDCDLFSPEGAPPSPCCALAVPLIIADEVIGALLVERRGHDRITQDDLDVLEPLAAQLAISVSNALLYERVRKQTVELEARVAQRTAEIRQQHERTAAMLRSVADAVIVFDLHGQVVMTNPVARELFDRHDLDMNLTTRVEELITRALDPQDGRDQADRSDIIEVGNVALQAKAARVVEGDAVLGSVVVLRDISRLKEVDRMKDQFVSNVSHELRTPLANLKVYLSLLEQGRPERRANYLEVMSREVARLERLIEDLLHISRLQADRRLERVRPRALVDVDCLIETVLSNNTAWAESERRQLHYERLSPTLPPVEADEDQLVRALTNLIANAINYTAPGGQITVRSRVEPAEQGAPDWVMIEVADDGIGIPADEIESIFDRFYRGSNVSPSIPGTGLGLAIIKDIVTMHHGEIQVESRQGYGSTFRLKLPVHSGHS